MRRIGIYMLLFGCVLSVAWAQSPPMPNVVLSSPPLVLYDNFNGPRIDPAKWSDWNATQQALEVVRQLSPPYQGEGNNGRLRMFQNAYSLPGLDAGDTYGWVGLQFTNPASVEEVSFTVAVKSAAVSNCQTNYSSGGSTAWAGLVGRFFNYIGPDQPTDAGDVQAGISLTRNAAFPTGPVGVEATVISQDGSVSQYQFIGYVSLGETTKLRVKWDRLYQRFEFQLSNNPPVYLSYTGVPDSSPPKNALKAFWVGRGTPNCNSTPLGSAMMDAYFDNVYVNAQ